MQRWVISLVSSHPPPSLPPFPSPSLPSCTGDEEDYGDDRGRREGAGGALLPSGLPQVCPGSYPHYRIWLYTAVSHHHLTGHQHNPSMLPPSREIGFILVTSMIVFCVSVYLPSVHSFSECPSVYVCSREEPDRSAHLTVSKTPLHMKDRLPLYNNLSDG